MSPWPTVAHPQCLHLQSCESAMILLICKCNSMARRTSVRTAAPSLARDRFKFVVPAIEVVFFTILGE